MSGPQRWPGASADAIELATWMEDRLAEGLIDTVAKRDRYGKSDLEVMGAAMGRLADVGPAKGAELACAFYALGKIARIIAGDHSDDDDSWWDLVVYAMFGLRAAEQGQL